MCGFVGIVGSAGTGPSVSGEIHLGLQALQHRGQDSAGIATISDGGERFFMRRGLGTVAQALGAAELDSLEGPIGLGHVRYPTIGAGSLEDAQPFFYRQPGVLMAHNGNLTNYDQLKRGLTDRSIHLLSECDVEPALCEFADALVARRGTDHTLADATAALEVMQQRVRGAYSIVAALQLDGVATLVVVRDPHGIRPVTVGRRGDRWCAASESVAFDVLGYERAFEPPPGKAVFLRAGREPIYELDTPSEAPAPCVFEAIYFARPDSLEGSESVYEKRLALGTALSKRIQAKNIITDLVVPVPDTSRPAAIAIAEHLGLPQREGFIKNRYSGRTFIMPDALTRHAALRLKLNPLPSAIGGKRILLVDDSIVRGTTLRRVVKLARDAGAAEVHLAIHSPPVNYPCFYGIDMSTEQELFARKFDGTDLDALEQEAAASLGADSLTYLPVAALDSVFGTQRCAACFDGAYPLNVSADERACIARDRLGPHSNRRNGASEVRTP